MVSDGSPEIDSECDIAAVVYDRGEDPDLLLESFATGLAADGYAVAGFVQRGMCWTEGGLEMRPIGSQHSWRVSGPVSGGTACGLDMARLSKAGVLDAIPKLYARADLVVINRFGKLEVQGRGLASLISAIARSGTPLVTAVARDRFEAWNRFVGGMSVKLPCSHAGLDRWWRSLAVPPPAMPRSPPQVFCRDRR
jgi:hypothetical protein